MKEVKLTHADYLKLCNVINHEKRCLREELWNLAILKARYSEVEKVSAKEISKQFVTMNSIVEVIDPETNISQTIRLVYPDDVNIKEGDISVFSCLGSAVLGCMEGSIVDYNGPVGQKKLKIARIIYQPEANKVYKE